MKNKIYIFLLLSSIFMLSCEDFLDVETKGVVKEGEMFNNIQGYRDAMYGVYASLNSKELYGKNLSFGMIDQMALLFNNNRLEASNYPVNIIGKYDYENPEIISLITEVWAKSYNTIASINNILKNIKKSNIEDSDIKLIKAEALGLRAFLHFNLVRLFATNYTKDKESVGIPYSYSFSSKSAKFNKTKEVYVKILQDLETSEKLIEDATISESTYCEQRVLHFNQDAIWAIKARVYHTMGNKEKALKYAKKVINQDKYKFIKSENFKYLHKGYLALTLSTATVESFNECIWGIYSNKSKEEQRKTFFPKYVTRNIVFVRDDYREVFEADNYTAISTDCRFTEYFKVKQIGNCFIKLGDKNMPEYTGRITGINMIRISEMYYIMADAIYDSNKKEALKYLNTVIEQRGLLAYKQSDLKTKEDWDKAVLSEYTKEYWGEGMLFFECKRLNKNMTNFEGTNFEGSDKIYVLPIPEKEKEFGNR